MNLEIRQKFDNFVKVIDKKEKEEWLKQTDNHVKYVPDLLVFNHDVIAPIDNIVMTKQSDKLVQEKNLMCECEISQGYSSFEKSIQSEKGLSNGKENKLNIKKSEQIKEGLDMSIYGSENSIKSFKINYMGNNEILLENKNKNNSFDEISLLEDDYVLDKIENKINKDELNLIKPELKNKFKINDSVDKKKLKDNNQLDTNKKLEKTYEKILFKSGFENKNSQKVNQFELANYLKKNNEQDVLSNLNDFIEYIFTESTRGWNYDSNIYVFNFEKFRENLKKIIVSQENQNFKFGLIYRDYANPKIYLEKDFSKGWVGIDCLFDSGKIQINNSNYTLKNKILYYCFKNLVKSTKFKKRIGTTNYKFIKKTIQIYGNKDLIIDIIFYAGFKN